MKHLIYSYLIAYILFVSCTHNYKVQRDPVSLTYKNKINYLGERRIGKIFFNNGEIISAKKIRIVQDTLKYVNNKTLLDSSITISDIKKISFKDRVIGFTHGFYLGCGTTLLFLAGLISGSDEPGSVYVIVGGFVAGGILVGIPGAIIGSKLNYTFVDRVQK